MRNLLTAAALLAALATAAPVPAAAEITADTLTDTQVRAAIDAIVEELHARKDPAHYWDPAHWTDTHGSKFQVGGYTALVVLSLLHAGQSYQDPRLRDAVDHLETYGMEGTYAVAVRAHVWAHLPARYRDALEKDTRWLLESFSPRAACWKYDADPHTRYQDNSLRQYGALGLWEAAKRGAHIDRRVWQMLEDAFVRNQLPDGAWNYREGQPPRGSMTAAGLMVLFITQDLLHAQDHLEIGRGRRRHADDAIERGLAWMAANFSATENPGRPADFYYYLYGVERVGLASGYRRFGEHDWYRAGAAELVRRLCRIDEDGERMIVHEHTGGDGRGGAPTVRELAFALLFLSRGRVPVAINKLAVDGVAWNNRPRDVANIAADLSGRTEQETSWQIVAFDAGPEAWLDAPLLYLASHEALPWLDPIDEAVRAWRRAGGDGPAPTTPELEALRRHLDLGGLLFAAAEGGGRSFAESVETIGTLLYPHLAWRDLPEDHPAFGLVHPIEGRRPPLRGLSNGVRELIVLAPAGDLPRSFQVPDEKRRGQFDVAANLWLYASELDRARPRLAEHLPDLDATPPDSAPTVTVFRASHAGNWDPEPAAFDVHRARLAAAGALDLRTVTAPLADLASVEPRPVLVHLAGIEAAALTEAERAALRDWITAGGRVLVETPGGTGAFTESIETQLAALLGVTVEPLGHHPVVTGEGLDGGVSMVRAAYRPSALRRFGGRETAPRLRSLAVDGEVRVIFSREDLSNALLDQPCWGVAGYETGSAAGLMGNLLRWARGPGP